MCEHTDKIFLDMCEHTDTKFLDMCEHTDTKFLDMCEHTDTKILDIFRTEDRHLVIKQYIDTTTYLVQLNKYKQQYIIEKNFLEKYKFGGKKIE